MFIFCRFPKLGIEKLKVDSEINAQWAHCVRIIIAVFERNHLAFLASNQLSIYVNHILLKNFLATVIISFHM